MIVMTLDCEREEPIWNFNLVLIGHRAAFLTQTRQSFATCDAVMFSYQRLFGRRAVGLALSGPFECVFTRRSSEGENLQSNWKRSIVCLCERSGAAVWRWNKKARCVGTTTKSKESFPSFLLHI